MVQEKTHQQWNKKLYRALGYKLAYFLNEHTSVTANQVTYFRLGCGLLSVLLFGSAHGVGLQMAGVMLLLFGGLDAADGCLAQVQGKSYFGGWVDAFSDMVVYFLVLLSLAWRFNGESPGSLLAFLPLIIFSLSQILSLSYVARSNPKLFGDAFASSRPLTDSEKQQQQGLTWHLRMQLAPYMQNYQLILIIGALTTAIRGTVVFLFFFTAFWLGAVFLNTCRKGLALDLENQKKKTQ